MAQIIRRGTKADPRWLVRISRGRVNGKRELFNHTVRGTKRQAQAWAAEQERAMSLGTFIEPSRQTLREFLDDWLNKEAPKSARAETTVRHYAAQLTRYLPPTLEAKKLSELRTLDFDDLYGDLHRRGYAPRTVEYLHSILRRAFKYAVRAGLLSRNPTEDTTRPKRVTKEMVILDRAGVRSFLAAAASDAYHAYWRLLLETGLRPSEALGLKWEDIGSDELRVRRGARRENGDWIIAPCKTKKSRRTLSGVSPELRAALNLLRDRQRPAPGSGAFVFAHVAGRLPDPRSLQRHHFAKILERADLPPMRVYDLRHTNASLMLSGGVPVKLVSERLGHASTKVTLDTYAHTLAEDHTRLAEVSRIFSAVDVGHPGQPERVPSQRPAARGRSPHDGGEAWADRPVAGA